MSPDEAPLEKITADSPSLSDMPAIPAVPSEWKLAWQEFRGRYPKLSKLPGFTALLLFTVLGLSPLAIVSFLSGLLLPWYVWVIEPLALVVLAQVFVGHYSGLAYRTQVKTLAEAAQQEQRRLSFRIGELEKRFQPKLEIRFIPKEKPYEELHEDDCWQFRVAVVSPEPIPNVELIVNRLTVEGQHYDGVHLRPRHDQSEKGIKRVALTAFKPEYWNVLSTPHWGIVLNSIPIHAYGDIRFFGGAYEFELMASGGDAPPATRIVRVEISEKCEVVRFEVGDGRLSETFI